MRMSGITGWNYIMWNGGRFSWQKGLAWRLHKMLYVQRAGGIGPGHFLMYPNFLVHRYTTTAATPWHILGAQYHPTFNMGPLNGHLQERIQPHRGPQLHDQYEILGGSQRDCHPCTRPWSHLFFYLEISHPFHLLKVLSLHLFIHGRCTDITVCLHIQIYNLFRTQFASTDSCFVLSNSDTTKRI